MGSVEPNISGQHLHRSVSSPWHETMNALRNNISGSPLDAKAGAPSESTRQAPRQRPGNVFLHQFLPFKRYGKGAHFFWT